MLLMARSNDDTRYKDKLQQYSYCICDNSACSDIILYRIAYAKCSVSTLRSLLLHRFRIHIIMSK